MSRLFQYLRRYRDPHGALSMLAMVCRRAGGVRLVRVPMHPVLLAGRLGRVLGKLFGHLRLVAKARAHGGETLLVREFLTVPLFVLAPLLWPQRRSMWFLCHHNVGTATRSALHRFMLRGLYAAGFRFVVPESAEAWQPIAARPDPRRVLALPTPVPEALGHGRPLRPSGAAQVIGFVGNFRAEKSPLWALEVVAQAKADGRLPAHVQILVGTSADEVRRRWEDRARVTDTTTAAAYQAALQACDVLVLPYDETAYSHRISGVLAEAAAMGCVVVAPDLPVLRDQVLQPRPIGVCYTKRADLIVSVERALRLAADPATADAFAAYRAARSVDALVRVISRMNTA